MSRVLIKNYKIFFKEILNNQSLRTFSKKTNISYSCLKRWARGENLIPKEIFLKLLIYSKNKNYWLNNTEYKLNNWGQKIGGINAIKKLSKSKLNKRLEKARKCIKNRIPNVKINLNKNVCEFYGALMGDGCLSKCKVNRWYRYYIIFTGHKQLDKDYHENYLNNLIKKEFQIKPYIQLIKNVNARKMTLFNISLFKELKKLGFPVGKKGQKLKIPNRLLKLPWNLKKYLIRGIFDTDGCISARKDEGYKYPHIIITTSSKPLLGQLYKLLRERGYPAWITKSRREIKIKGIKNTTKWMNDVGSSNLKHKFKYEYWVKNKVLPTYLMGL